MTSNLKKIKRLSLLLVLCLSAGLAAPFGWPVVRAQPDPVPELLITELVPDSTNVGTADGYEFIEVYNNTTQPIDFKDYSIVYRYPGTSDPDLLWKPYTDHVIIPPRGTMVFWIMNGQNDRSTVDDFNANYGTSLIENVNIVRIPGGMHNSRDRIILIATNTGHELVSAAYNQGVNDVAENMGIKYTYPRDGGIEMVMISSRKERGTPGTLEPGQVPDEPLDLPPDTVAPTVKDLTPDEEVDLTKPIVLTAEAQDDRLVRTMTLHYKTERDGEYRRVNLSFGEGGGVPLFRRACGLGRQPVVGILLRSVGRNECDDEPGVYAFPGERRGKSAIECQKRRIRIRRTTRNWCRRRFCPGTVDVAD